MPRLRLRGRSLATRAQTLDTARLRGGRKPRGLQHKHKCALRERRTEIWARSDARTAPPTRRRSGDEGGRGGGGKDGPQRGASRGKSRGGAGASSAVGTNPHALVDASIGAVQPQLLAAQVRHVGDVLQQRGRGLVARRRRLFDVTHESRRREEAIGERKRGAAAGRDDER